MKQYQVLCLGGPADGRRIVFFKDKPPGTIRVPTTEMASYYAKDNVPYVVKDVDYTVQSLRGNKSQYFVAMQGNPSGDEVIEALLRGYNRREC